MQIDRDNELPARPGANATSSGRWRLREIALHIARLLGGFALAQYLTRDRLRILCYHGFSVGDEFKFAPVMFMRAETFERRMALLQKRRIPVIPLSEGIRRFKEGRISAAETIITLDDGWASNLTVGLPILERYGYPACVYLSTEHFDAGTEAFDMAVVYMIQTTSHQQLLLQNVHPLVDGYYRLSADRISSALELLAAARRVNPLRQRQKLLGPIAKALGHEVDEIFRLGRFRLMDRLEVQEIFRRGVDIQLHTHTHHLPDESLTAMSTEVIRNREIIQELVGTVADHFCYPSGDYSNKHPAWLASLGIISATTCDSGLNGPDAPVMLLHRYLDSDRFSDIAFEAEVCGLRELARVARSVVRQLLSPRNSELAN